MPTIISSTKLRNDYNAVSEECHDTGRPVFVTRNGNGDLAVMSIDTYERLTSGGISELRRLLAEGHADVVEGRTKPASAVIDELRGMTS